MRNRIFSLYNSIYMKDQWRETAAQWLPGLEEGGWAARLLLCGEWECPKLRLHFKTKSSVWKQCGNSASTRLEKDRTYQTNHTASCRAEELQWAPVRRWWCHGVNYRLGQCELGFSQKVPNSCFPQPKKSFKRCLIYRIYVHVLKSVFSENVYLGE